MDDRKHGSTVRRKLPTYDALTCIAGVIGTLVAVPLLVGTVDEANVLAVFHHASATFAAWFPFLLRRSSRLARRRAAYICGGSLLCSAYASPFSEPHIVDGALLIWAGAVVPAVATRRPVDAPMRLSAVGASAATLYCVVVGVWQLRDTPHDLLNPFTYLTLTGPPVFVVPTALSGLVAGALLANRESSHEWVLVLSATHALVVVHLAVFFSFLAFIPATVVLLSSALADGVRSTSYVRNG